MARRTHAHLPTLAGALLVACMAVPAAHAQAYASLVTKLGGTWMNVTNHGVLGNNFTTRAASLEYPGGSGYEHLTHAGLWLGARATDAAGSFTGVVTGGFDQFLGNPTASLTEYSPLGSSVGSRSNIPGSPVYDPAARSEDETLAIFDDHVAKRPLNATEFSRPMGLRVRQFTHAWTETGYRDFVIVRYVITSQSASPVQDLWVGLYAELASGNRNNFSSWPPGGGWFGHKLVEWDPAARMLREHYCTAPPVPASCNFAIAPDWAGLQLLTAPAAGQGVTLAAWSYSPGDPSRDEDVERYALMSAGTIADLSVPELQPRDGDPVELLAVGPFQLPATGDSVEVAFAFVGGADVPALQQHARSAQALHDAGYRLDVVDVPTGPPLPRLAVALGVNPAGTGRIELRIELPAAGPVLVELLDLAGRRLASESLATLAGGTHRVAFAPARPLAPGVYLARLSQGALEASARVVVLGR